MANERAKRVATRDDRQRIVKKKVELKEIGLLVITNMEPFKLDLCLLPQRQKDFRGAQLYMFLRLSEKLPPIDVPIVEEFVRNYDPADGSSVVKNRIVGIDEMILNKVLYLPISELSVGSEMPTDFVQESYFKSGVEAFEKSQGWKTGDALTPELGEWMRFVQKRLGLNRHVTYMARKLLFAAIGSLEGMVFNSAAYKATRIHAELEAKWKAGKVPALLCCNYVCEAICWQLKQPLEEKQTARSKGTVQGEEISQVATLVQNEDVEDVVEIITSSTPPVLLQTEANSPFRSLAWPHLNSKAKEVPISVELYERIGLAGTSVRAGTLKDLIQHQLDQVQQTVMKLEDESSLKKELDAEKKTTEDQKLKLQSLAEELVVAKEMYTQLETESKEKATQWGKDRQLLKSFEAISKQECGELRNELAERRRKGKEAEVESKRLISELVQQQKTLQTENSTLKAKIQELEKTLAESVQVPFVSNNTELSAALQQKLDEQQTLLEERDEQILRLETQVRELGANNEELTAKLEGEQPGDSDEDAEEDRLLDKRRCPTVEDVSKIC